jgi:hypothetical protein
VQTVNRSSRRALLVSLSYNSTAIQLAGTLEDQNTMYGARFSDRFALEDVIGSHALRRLKRLAPCV